MKKLVAVVMLGVSLIAGPVQAADAVEPPMLSFTNARSSTVSYISDTEYYRGTSLLFTNCVLQTTNGAIQGLDGVTIELKWGTTATNHTFVPTVQDAATGKWFLNMTVPTNWEAPNMQIKVTDANTNSYIYPWRLIHTKASM